jgi:hypothetical protein
VASPQSSANPKNADFNNMLNLCVEFGIFGFLQFADPIFLWFADFLIVDLRFADPGFFLRTENFCKSANTYFFSLQIWHIMLLLRFVQKKKCKCCVLSCRNMQICGLRISHENLRIPNFAD